MSWGRGGAGNIAQQEEVSKKLGGDLEANSPSTLSALNPSTEPTPSSVSPWAHMGRGGAGNWYSPSTLSENGSFLAPDDATKPPASSSTPTMKQDPLPISTMHPYDAVPIARSGRGGVGNMVWSDADRALAAEKAAKERESKVKEQVAQDVELGLLKPGKAFLGTEERRGFEGPEGWIG